MWGLILYLLFGIGQPTNSQSNVGAAQSIGAPSILGDHGGETETPLPPRPKGS